MTETPRIDEDKSSMPSAFHACSKSPPDQINDDRSHSDKGKEPDLLVHELPHNLDNSNVYLYQVPPSLAHILPAILSRAPVQALRPDGVTEVVVTELKSNDQFLIGMSSFIEEPNTEPEPFNEENLGSSDSSSVRGRSRTPKMLNMSSYTKSRASSPSSERLASQNPEVNSRKSSLLSAKDHLEKNDSTIADMARDAREEMLQSTIRTLQEGGAALRAQLKVESLHVPDSSPSIG